MITQVSSLIIMIIIMIKNKDQPFNLTSTKLMPKIYIKFQPNPAMIIIN
jgi:hypothetical protein